MKKWLVIILAFTFYSTHVAAQDRCKDILANGVWDYQVGMNETQYVSAFLNWYGSSTASRSGTTKRQSLTGSAVYEGAPVSLGLTNDDQRNQEFLSKLEKLNSGYEQYDSATVTFVKTASSVIVKAWSDCMTNTSISGVRASLKYTGNPKDLIVDLRYQPINNVPSARVKIGVPRSIKCEKANQAISITIAGTAVRCTRSSGESGAVVLASDTVVYPDKTLNFPEALIQTNLSGKLYARCDVFEDIKNGQDTLEAPESLPDSGRDIGGGTPSTTLGLEVPPDYELTHVRTHCQKLDCDNPCAFVRGLDNIVWTIPKRKAQASVSTDSCRVTVWMSGTRQKIVTGVERKKHPNPLVLTYGKKFSVEFPTNALDVKLYCDVAGSQRIFSLSDIQREGDQIFLRATRQSSTSRIMDMAVSPFDLGL